MKFSRIDENTIKCFISNEELEEYNVEFADFLTRTEKAKEVVHEIIEQAIEQIDYKPPKYAFDLQIMLVQDQGVVLTFSEKDPLNSGKEFVENALKDMRKFLEKAAKDKIENEFGKLGQNEAVQDPAKKTDGKSKISSTDAIFRFESWANLIDYARTMPNTLRVASSLYKRNDAYYLLVSKGGASYDNYAKACVQALEFSMLFCAEVDKIEIFKRDSECLIQEKAIRKLGK